ncbi:MAG: 30S ribosomal protein S16 [Candidatus Pacebacteria bacterium]|nr:30S ribosomal protein S16 [Candidatus Paceibacterota bacterium]
MLKIRLQRVGRKHDPSYRVILTDSRQGPKSGNFIENLGFYDTIRKIKQIKADRVKYWISKGAQLSDTVHNIMVSEKIIEGKKINVLPKKSPIVKEKDKEEEDKVVEEKSQEISTEESTEIKEEIVEAPAEEVKIEDPKPEVGQEKKKE